MTEPDEALLWARELTAKEWERHGGSPHIVALARSGDFDHRLTLAAEGYRAGAAASAERIKVLEERVAELEEVTHRIKYPRLRRRADKEPDTFARDRLTKPAQSDHARALSDTAKEADREPR